MKRLSILVAAALLFPILLPSLDVPAQTRGARSASVRSASAPLSAAKLREFDEFVRRQMEADRTPALTIGFVKNGQTWVKGYGYADLENKVPATADSAYRLASVSKPLTAVAVLQLAERNKLNLDDEVQRYVPYFPKKQWPVTVRQLLGHLGGISHYKDDASELHIKEHKDTRASIAIFESFDLVAEPGTRYNYSSYGFNLLGAVIEGASGMPYGEYMRKNVWGPAGMNDTRMDDPLEVIPNRVRGYQLVGGQVRNSEFIDISSRFGGGGTRSTVPDLLRFAQALNTGKLLSPASLEAMYDSMTTKAGRLTDYGMGWQTNPTGGRFVLAHGGAQQETRTSFYNFPSRNLAIAAACNFESASPDTYVWRLFQLLNDEPLAFSAYTGDPSKDAVYRALEETFRSGLSYYERRRAPLAATPEETRTAFAYFNESVSPDALTAANLPQTRQKINAGRHPSAGRAYVKVGSAMASKLAEAHGPASIEKYTAAGPVAFFADYVALYKSRPGAAGELRFTEQFEQQVARWAAVWAKTNTARVRLVSVSAGADLNVIAPTLRTAFAGAEIYPNFLSDFASATRNLIQRGEREQALKSARLAHELYPASANANVYLAVAQLAFGGAPAEQATLLRKAKEIDPTGIAGPGSLNSIAYDLAANGRRDAGLELLKLAADLHPKEANLYDSIGEFYLLKGEKDKAVEFYSKALEIDPNLATAQRALERLRK